MPRIAVALTRIIWFVAFMLAACASPSVAASVAATVVAPVGYTIVTRAEFVPSDARRPPADDAPWLAVALPDEWRVRGDDVDQGWYRIRFSLDEAPTGLLGMYVRLRRAERVVIYVNGTRVGGSAESNAETARRVGAGREATINLSIPPLVFRAGENVMHVRMAGTSHPLQIHGLGRVHLGDARSVRRLYVENTDWGFVAKRNAIVVALATGLVTLFLWLAHRSDRLMFWYSAACLSWGAVGYAYIKVRWSVPIPVTDALYFYVTYGLVVPTLIVALRTVDVRWPRLELPLWLFFVIQMTYPFWLGDAWPGALLAWDVTNAGLLAAMVGIVVREARKPLAWTTWLLLLALAAMATAIAFEAARLLGWVDVESLVVRHYHVPVMLLAMGAACFERHARSVGAIERLNRELEGRVARAAHELQTKRALVEEARRERAIAEERERVVADMHDGLGASLVSLLRLVQSGNAEFASIRQRAQDALRQMRIAIAALQPRGGDLTAVIADLREQIDGLLAGSGVALTWRVDELPRFSGLKASTVLILQRMVFEALGNVLKHARADSVRFSASARPDGGVEIRIADNGRGFDTTVTHAGLGLSNMRSRAGQIGATLAIESQAGVGTTVSIILPPGLGERARSEGEDRVLSVAAVSTGRHSAIACIIAGILLAVVAVAPRPSAAAQPDVVVIERAEFVPSSAGSPPSAGAEWKPVVLPDLWRDRSDIPGVGWYRIKMNIEHKPANQHAIVLRHRRAHDLAIFVNGKVVGTAADNQSLAGRRITKGLGSPIRHYVLPAMLRAGENVIHVRLEGSSHPALMNGLGRVYFGEARAVRGVYNDFNELGFAARRDAIFVALAAGLIALSLWFVRRQDRALFWFSATCLSWSAMGIAYLFVRWVDAPTIVDWFLFYPTYGLVIPTLILSLRSVNERWPRVEAALWLFFAIELTFPFWGSEWPYMHLAWDGSNALLLLGAVALVAAKTPRPLRWTVVIQIGALTAMAACMAHEFARYFGWVDAESAEIRHYHVLMMLFAMGALCFDRYARAIRQAQRARDLLEQGVAQKLREIEQSHRQMDLVDREQAMRHERQRVRSEMHDGIGASLTGLLRYIDAENCQPKGMERRVQEALQEMRIAIDALRSHPGDLATVLGTLRYRLDDAIQASGMRLVWEVSDLPEVSELQPAAVFALQRVLLGAITNAIKHAEASILRVTAHTQADGSVEITVQDDGKGFDVDSAADSPGLLGMRRRSKQLGAELDIDSRPGGGTRVRLLISAPANSARYLSEAAARGADVGLASVAPTPS